MTKPIFYLTHPIQYFSPMFRMCHDLYGDAFFVQYVVSEESASQRYDTDFSKHILWDQNSQRENFELFGSSNNFKGDGSFFDGFSFSLILKISLAKNHIVFFSLNNINFLIPMVLRALTLRPFSIRFENSTHLKNQNSSKLNRLIKIFLWRRAVYVFSIGVLAQAEAEQFGVPSAKVVFSPYCVDSAIFSCGGRMLERNVGTFKFVFCGKFIPRKNVINLVKGFKYLDAKVHQKLELHLIGQGPQYQAVVAEIGSRSNIVLHDFVQSNDLASILEQSDCLMMPSLEESWGLVANEAMMCGLLVGLSVLSGSYQEFKGSSGVFGLSDLSEKGLAMKMMEIVQLSDYERVNKRAENYEAIQSYSVDTVAANFKCLF